MVQRFQKDEDAPPIFVLSLKAGGTGLNLQRASHVFHFDRWWNPAVEDQATDRAFRIGQTRRVQVHKLVCAGTLEERIDEMIAKKRGLAARVVGQGEGWLTELSLDELRFVMALRRRRWRNERRPPGLPALGPATQGEGGIRAFPARPSRSWWARRWLAVLEALQLGGRLARGRAYARRGQVIDLSIEEGLWRACRDRARSRTPSPSA